MDVAQLMGLPNFFPTYPLALAAGLSIAYLSGSIPVALIIGRMTSGIDIRKHGSGNAGTTNALRVLGWGPGIAVLFFDVLKGALACLGMVAALLLARDLLLIDYYAEYVLQGTQARLISSLHFTTGLLYDIPCAFALLTAVLGHMFSPFMRFRGGKGVATALGGFLMLMPYSALVGLAAFVVVVLISRYVSLGSVTAVLTLPLSAWFFYGSSLVYVIFATLTMLVVIFAHRKNIYRLAHGTESRFSVKKTDLIRDQLEDQRLSTLQQPDDEIACSSDDGEVLRESDPAEKPEPSSATGATGAASATGTTGTTPPPASAAAAADTAAAAGATASAADTTSAAGATPPAASAHAQAAKPVRFSTNPDVEEEFLSQESSTRNTSETEV
ncbi:MAG: glycerol-3-phosphate 1-O-acyltransferase PlsY [Coriobacteriales bacterium]|jgi:glycerol-3-phosphate acyltransferase PlsY|nr:glycerol-3-phosphate 1-O-acyltransferase PlsY [Coriobacteriales bacterium]